MINQDFMLMKQLSYLARYLLFLVTKPLASVQFLYVDSEIPKDKNWILRKDRHTLITFIACTSKQQKLLTLK